MIEKKVRKLEDYLPYGAGWLMAEPGVDLSESSDQKLVIRGSFRHQRAYGGHGATTDHTVLAYASLASGFTLRVTGSNRDDCKAEIKERFTEALNSTVTV